MLHAAASFCTELTPLQACTCCSSSDSKIAVQYWYSGRYCVGFASVGANCDKRYFHICFLVAVNGFCVDVSKVMQHACCLALCEVPACLDCLAYVLFLFITFMVMLSIRSTSNIIHKVAHAEHCEGDERTAHTTHKR